MKRLMAGLLAGIITIASIAPTWAMVEQTTEVILDPHSGRFAHSGSDYAFEGVVRAQQYMYVRWTEVNSEGTPKLRHMRADVRLMGRDGQPTDQPVGKLVAVYGDGWYVYRIPKAARYFMNFPYLDWMPERIDVEVQVKTRLVESDQLAGN